MRNRQRKLLELLDKSGASLHALLTRLTLRKDIAEELMQELFIKLSNSKGLQRSANPIAYARRVAINLAFDWRRSCKRNPVELGVIGEPASKELSPLAKLIQKEDLEEILNAIGRLNGASREVLVMRYIQEQSNDYIAEQLGKTAHQVRALCYKALTHLRDALDAGESLSFEKEIDDAKI